MQYYLLDGVVAQIDKLIERLKARPVETDYADVRQVLEAFGWRLRHSSGSHHTFGKEGSPVIVTLALVHGRKVKRTYVDLVCKTLGLE